MPRNIQRRLPRAPTRVAPSYGKLPHIDDPALRELLRNLHDRVSAQDEQLQEVRTFALQAGSPIDAFNQRLKNVGEPVQRDDAVPLWYLRKFVNEQTAYTRRRIEAESGGDGGLGPIGAGSDPPTVALANLYDAVVTYATANPITLANSCPDQGGTMDWLRGLVAYLQGIDERVGGNGKRGDVSDPSEDAIAYYHGVLPPAAGSNNVYVVDVIARHCTATAEAAWQNVTTSAAAGAWLPAIP